MEFELCSVPRCPGCGGRVVSGTLDIMLRTDPEYAAIPDHDVDRKIKIALGYLLHITAALAYDAGMPLAEMQRTMELHFRMTKDDLAGVAHAQQ